jgi:RNA polymerase sigma-70 factor (ECF subfamily)
MTTRLPSDQDSDRDSDEQLLARTARGDAQAFALLFRRLHGRVYRFALHMTGIGAVADDVTQDVFMAVMRDAARYQGGRSGVVAWLCGIARNCARQRFDRDRRFQSLDPGDTLDEDDLGGEGAVQTDPLGDLTRAEGIQRVRKAVLSLPVRYREVVVLCDLQELTYAEAAEALSCAVGTVRSRLHRGRLLLAAKLSSREPSTETEGASSKLTESAKPDGSAKPEPTATPEPTTATERSVKLTRSRSCA